MNIINTMDLKKNSNTFDIVKQGYLYIKRPPGNKWNRLKAWHERFFILRVFNSNAGAELVMYNSLKDAKDNHPSLSVFLRDTVHIGITSESHRFPNTFVLVFTDRSPLFLASKNEFTVRSWMLALDLTSRNKDIIEPQTVPAPPKFKDNENSETTGSDCSCAPAFVKESSILCTSSLEDEQSFSLLSPIFKRETDFDKSPIGVIKDRFPVFFLKTETAEKTGLRGNLELVIFTRGLGVSRIGDIECFLEWPVAVIRQYRFETLHKINCKKQRNSKDQEMLITIEVGRQCPSGEGVFKFTSAQGLAIMRQLKNAVSNWASYRVKEKSKKRRRTRSLNDPFLSPISTSVQKLPEKNLATYFESKSNKDNTNVPIFSQKFQSLKSQDTLFKSCNDSVSDSLIKNNNFKNIKSFSFNSKESCDYLEILPS